MAKNDNNGNNGEKSDIFEKHAGGDEKLIITK